MSAVDVVMPVRNAGPRLAAAVADVLAQTHRALRLLAVDDASEDGSAAVLRAAAARDARVAVLACRGRGLVDALNTGLAAATAPLVARFDADDRMDPRRLAEQAAALDADPGLGAVGCRVCYAGRREGFRAYVAWSNALLTFDELRRNRFVESPLVHPTVCFRRGLVGRHGPYRGGEFPEDYELWLRWFEAGVRMRKLPGERVTWRESPGRLTRTDPRYAADAFFRAKTPYLARWLERNNPHHPAVVVWGAGRRSRLRFRLLEAHGVRAQAFIDINPRKLGTAVGGVPVRGRDGLPPPGRAFVVSYVSNRGAREDIRGFLRARGYAEERDFLCAA